MRSLVSAMFAILTVVRTAAQTPEPCALTRIGQVCGAEESGIAVYKGIPYAAPPVNELRWKPPIPPASRTVPLRATAFASSCIQPSRAAPQDEDCLYLNIWSKVGSRNAPVMVWIHGGGYLTGSGSLPYYDGTALARHGAVVVTFNYRLGILGFMAHPHLSRESPEHVSGNYGFLDQVAALKWVHDNAGNFGGDPRNVTVFGESAGAASVSCLLFSPLAKGLFQRAIAESGSLDDQLRELRTARGGIDSAERQGVETARQLGCGGAAALPCLRQMSGRLILKMLQTIPCLDCTQRDTFGPIADGYAIPGQPHVLLDSHKINPASIMVGSNRGEGTIVIGARPIPNPEGYKAWIGARFHDRAGQVLAGYPAGPDEDVRGALRDVYTDSWYRCPAQSLADAARISYLYLFSRVRPGTETRTSHASEIPYVFDTLRAAGGHAEDTDRTLAALMSAAWYRFAATGDPNGGDLPVWPAYDRRSQALMEFGDGVKVASARACDVWQFAGHTSGIPGGNY